MEAFSLAKGLQVLQNEAKASNTGKRPVNYPPKDLDFMYHHLKIFQYIHVTPDWFIVPIASLDMFVT